MTEPIQENTAESFEQKLARAEGVDKDMAKNIADNWQSLVGMVVIVLLGVWVVNEYRAAKEKRIGEASTRFSQIQNTFEKAIDSNEKDSKVIQDNIRTLNDTFSGTSYSQLTSLYNGLLLKKQGKFKEAEKELKAISSSVASSDFSLADLNKELASIALSRNLIDEGREQEAVSLLKQLVKNSKIINVEALLILARLGVADIEQIAKELKNSRPEFSDIVDREMINFGIAFN